MVPEALIRARALAVRLGSRKALAPLDLDLAPGEALLLTGASGAGKSTLLRALAGVLPEEAAASGELTVAGLTPPDPDLPRRVGFVPQNPAHALFLPTVAAEVAAGPRHLGLDDPEGRGLAALAALKGSGLRDRECRALSSGEAQRVAIAAALASGPELLLLDEPTSFLDAGAVAALALILRDLRASGTALLVAEHRPERLAFAFDRTLSLGGEAALPAASPTGVSPPKGMGRTVLRAEGLAYADVLKRVDLEIRAGERLALTGANGAGKTTLARLLAGLLRPSRGRIARAGRVGLTPPDPREALLTETAAEELRLGPENFGLPCDGAMLERVGLQGEAATRPASLSLGGQGRLSVGAAAACAPALLILDEPTVGQDARSLERLLELLAVLAEAGTAVLLVTHDEAVARAFAPRIERLEGGRLLS